MGKSGHVWAWLLSVIGTSYPPSHTSAASLPSAIVAMILMRTLHLDFNRYNNPENTEEAQEEVGWKLVHADVFRPGGCTVELSS